MAECDLSILSLEEKANLLHELCNHTHQYGMGRLAGPPIWNQQVAMAALKRNEHIDYYLGMPIKINFGSTSESGRLYERDCEPGYKFAEGYKTILMQRSKDSA